MKKNLHLICNAHIDVVWLWEIEEGVAETLSTFRVAADFCEEYDGFVFCHNEALLYEWIEENDPELLCNLAAVYISWGKLELAEKTLLKAEELSPEEQIVQMWRSELEKRKSM